MDARHKMQDTQCIEDQTDNGNKSRVLLSVSCHPCFFNLITLAVSKITQLQYTNIHTHPFNSPLSGTTQVSRYQKGKTNLDFTGARDSERHWYQLGHMQVCTSLQTDNHDSTSLLKVFYRPDALPAAQPTVSKHCQNSITIMHSKIT